MIRNPKTKIIDASTAFRTEPTWTYGLPELHQDQRNKIHHSSRVAVPGCHATGFILAMHPLVAEGIIPNDYPASCYSLTGYSGGGKKLISDYQNSCLRRMQRLCNHTNYLDIFVFGHEDQILLVSRFDNLGKGASGAAIQNMNIMLGFDEGVGLEKED